MEYRYKGIRFDNKYEAQWAVFLDALQIKWAFQATEYGNIIALLDKDVSICVIADRESWISFGESWAVEEASLRKWIAVRSEGLLFNNYMHTWLGIFIPITDFSPNSTDVYHMYTNEWGYNEKWGDLLACPICATKGEIYCYVHFGNPTNVSSNDTWGVAWEGRGDAIKIPMWCEAGHGWTVRYGFHKGHTYRGIEDVSELNDDLLLWLADWDDNKLAEALRIVNGMHWGRKLPPSLRFRVFKRDGYRCQICGRSASDGVTLEVDHKVAWASAGGNNLDNLWTLCEECNAGKSDKPL